ncbi:Heavy metal transport/detoxification protein [Segniliparus rotundus DSM 44985]|uniref:Heavy metal transport/detoxification protein n=1 Tax=Segniliparus rotundus (strain ATCC BAA-972 / CDC 1076 / CIP 108378 / DSM 44985 / JCM 13578) TaxID=640132 RepID=D6ZD35_SEGRD|nr:heavy-metal-associated domain-containing protein [Segniliparus rotundus]ADG99222.1 Heavy metal transport/detoxification protein [Segniliparus rotundus DSM 44985]
MTVQSYYVTGMTCGHCVSAVSKELSAISGVSDVSVNLETGEVRVASHTPLGEGQVRDAVTEAGYGLV